MAEQRQQQSAGTHPPEKELVQIRKRLREGSLQEEDVKVLERIVLDVEQASRALRAAMVE